MNNNDPIPINLIGYNTSCASTVMTSQLPKQGLLKRRLIYDMPNKQFESYVSMKHVQGGASLSSS